MDLGSSASVTEHLLERHGPTWYLRIAPQGDAYLITKRSPGQSEETTAILSRRELLALVKEPLKMGEERASDVVGSGVRVMRGSDPRDWTSFQVDEHGSIGLNGETFAAIPRWIELVERLKDLSR